MFVFLLFPTFYSIYSFTWNSETNRSIKYDLLWQKRIYGVVCSCFVFVYFREFCIFNRES